jgi:sigma-70-like protein
MKLLQMPARVSIVVRASEDGVPEGEEGFDPSQAVASVDDFRCGTRIEINEKHSPRAIYRNHTVVLLRKYFRMSLEIGRMPSLLGGELFRAKVTAYKAHTFEDSVIFVHDMEQCLGRLDQLSRLLIARIFFQEFTHDEVAAELRITRRQVINRMFDALDRTTEILLDRELLDPVYRTGDAVEKKPPASEGAVRPAKILEFRKADL